MVSIYIDDHSDQHFIEPAVLAFETGGILDYRCCTFYPLVCPDKRRLDKTGQ
jgi:hypothetical protein